MNSRGAIVAIFAVILLTAPLCAQESPGEIAQFILVKAKPDRVQEFEEGTKAHMDWHRQENDTWTWSIWQYETGEQMGQYLAVSTGHRWEAFDARAEFIAQDGADAAERMGPYMESMTTWYSRIHTERSNWPADASPKMVSVLHYRLKAGKAGQFIHAIDRINNALQEAGWPRHYLWEQVLVGSGVPAFNYVRPLQNWADLNPAERSARAAVEEVLGRRETDAIWESFLDSIESLRSEILRYRPDLSYVPEGQ